MANGKADATLVAAAYRMGLANVPSDLSKIFDSQLESITALHKAQSDAFAGSMQGVANFGSTIGKDKKLREKNRREDTAAWNKEFLGDKIDTLAKDQAASVASHANHYANGGGPPKGSTEAAGKVFEDIKTELKTYEYMDLNKKQRKRQAQLRGQIIEHRDSINEGLGNYKAHTQAHASGMVNMKTSFTKKDENGATVVDVEKATLYEQVINHDSNFEFLEIEAAYRETPNGKRERGYYYSEGRLGKQRQHNARLKELYEIGAKFKADSQEDKEAALASGIIEPSTTKERLWISEKDLFAGVVFKDEEQEVALNGILAEVVVQAGEYVKGGPEGKTGIPLVGSYAEIQGDVVANYEDQLMLKKESAADISNRAIRIGGNEINWKKSLQENREIDEAVVSQLGIGSNVFTMLDVDKSGSIGPGDMDGFKDEEGKLKMDDPELKEHLYAKNLIIEQMTNPKTAAETQVWAQEFAKFLGQGDDSITGQAFAKTKTKLNPKSATRVTTKTPIVNPWASIPSKGLMLAGQKVGTNAGELDVIKMRLGAGNDVSLNDGSELIPDGDGGWTLFKSKQSMPRLVDKGPPVKRETEAQWKARRQTSYPSTAQLIAYGLRSNHSGWQGVTEYGAASQKPAPVAFSSATDNKTITVTDRDAQALFDNNFSLISDME